MVDLFAQVGLGVVRVKGGPPKLERDEGHQEDAGAKKDHSDPRPDPRLLHTRSLGVVEQGKGPSAESGPMFGLVGEGAGCDWNASESPRLHGGTCLVDADRGWRSTS